MEIPQRFCVRWNSYKTNLQTAFPKLLTSEHFVDVTLACEKQYLKCHKIVLSACSVYFEDLLVNNPCQHPIIFMKDVAFWEMKALVEFMYKGEVNVSQEQLDSLLKSAESLQIRGLSGAKQWASNANPEDDGKKKEDDDCRSLLITSCEGSDGADVKIEEQEEDISDLLEVKEETEDDADDNSYMDNTDEESHANFTPEETFPQQTSEPGSSSMSEFISIDDLSEVQFMKELKLKSSETKPAKKRMMICRRKARRSCYKQYTMNSMWSALERIEQGLSVYRASLEFGVPRKTLRNWMKKYNILSHFDLRKQNREFKEEDDEEVVSKVKFLRQYSNRFSDKGVCTPKEMT